MPSTFLLCSCCCCCWLMSCRAHHGFTGCHIQRLHVGKFHDARRSHWNAYDALAKQHITESATTAHVSQPMSPHRCVRAHKYLSMTQDPIAAFNSLQHAAVVLGQNPDHAHYSLPGKCDNRQFFKWNGPYTCTCFTIQPSECIHLHGSAM